MKLTEREQERLAVALNVALGIVSTDDVDPEELGYSWRCRMNDGEIRSVCHNILFGSIIKAGEPEPKEPSE